MQLIIKIQKLYLTEDYPKLNCFSLFEIVSCGYLLVLLGMVVKLCEGKYKLYAKKKKKEKCDNPRSYRKLFVEL